MSFTLSPEMIAGAVAALIAALAGAAQWVRRAYLQRASDLAREARIHAENRARVEEEKAAIEHAQEVAKAAETRREADADADAKADSVKAEVARMGDDEVINEAARLAAERGWK